MVGRKRFDDCDTVQSVSQIFCFYMHPLAETLLNEPVIAAVKTDEALTAALA